MDKNSTEGDDTVDIEQDGIPDIIELKGSYKVLVKNPFTGEMQEIDTWSIYSNPAKADSDGDGLSDIEDLRPMKFDTVVVEENDTNIKFNTGRVWYNITCSSYDFWDNMMYFMDMSADNYIPVEEFSVIMSCHSKNEAQEFSLEELSYIGIVNNEGSKLYMHGETDAVRETIFQNITGRESKYYRHVGILFEEKWEECPKGTESGFFSGAVLSEADINFSNKIFFIQDISTVLNSLVQIGAVVISIIVITEATPYVIANLQALAYYVKTFGVLQGIQMHLYLGVKNLPNGVISWLQTDIADGDSYIDDGVNFSSKAAQHMKNRNRYVPVQTLQEAIKYGEKLPDPRGSRAMMYYTTMYKNGKLYNLEVLYDASTNMIYHFEYARKAMGNLPAIK